MHFNVIECKFHENFLKVVYLTISSGRILIEKHDAVKVSFNFYCEGGIEQTGIDRTIEVFSQILVCALEARQRT